MAGIKSQRAGASYESIFESMCTYSGIECTRIPSGCRQAGRRLIRVKTPFDWIISYRGLGSALIDTKSNDGQTFPNSLIVQHQVLILNQHERQGTPAGYVVGFRTLNVAVFIPARILYAAYGTRGSLRHDTTGVIQLGSYSRPDIRKILHTRV